MLKSPEQVLMRAAMETPDVAIQIGTRIFAGLAPASVGYPFVTYRRSAIERNQGLSVPVGVPRVSVDFSVYAETYETARKVADSLRQCLDGYGGESYGVLVRQTSLEAEFDDFVTLQGGELPQVYQITQTYDVMWQET